MYQYLSYFELYVRESELYTRTYDCMKTFYKVINVTAMLLLDLLLLYDRRWMKKEQFKKKKEKSLYIAIHISYCDTI